MSHDQAPIDFFKQTHVPKQGIKEVPQKINDLVHCDDQALLKENDVKAGHRNKATWTTQINDTRCYGKDRAFRTFEKIVAGSQASEAAEIERERKLGEYHAQPQRGTQRGGKDNQFKAAQDNYINRQENPIQKAAASQKQGQSNRSQPGGKPSNLKDQRSASQLETVETVRSLIHV